MKNITLYELVYDNVMFSQEFEDMFLNKYIFKNKKNGVYIELGALDGVIFSNTKFYETFLDWTGVLIEPHPIQYKKLVENRPNNYLFNELISCKKEPLTFKYFEEYHSTLSGVESTLPRSHNTSYFDNDIYKDLIQGTITLKPKTLTEIIKSTPFKRFDLLSLDVEGHEYEVLSSWDFSIPIDVILIETLPDNEYKNFLCNEILLKNNYHLFAKIGKNEVYLLDKKLNIDKLL